jgi:SSS family solute:Na+ symporter
VVFAQFALFLLIGVMLFVYYQRFPSLPAAIQTKTDAVFPHFIVTQLPIGIVGLVIAAIFAAAMSTLSSSLNSLAATALTDFYQPLAAPNRPPDHYLKVARWLTAGWGVVQIGVATVAFQMKPGVVNSVLAIASFTNGPILGLFLLTILARHVNATGALAGIVAGIAVMTLVWLRLDVSWQWYVLIGSAVTFVAGNIASLRRAAPTP